MNRHTLPHIALALTLTTTFSADLLAQNKPFKMGDTAGQIFEQVNKVAEIDSLKIQIAEFSDCVQPNAAPSSGDRDAVRYSPTEAL